MRTGRSAVVSVTALLLIALVGHFCPLSASALGGAHGTPAGAPHGAGGSHDHHDTHLSTCLPGAVLPDSGAPVLGPGITAQPAIAIVVSLASPALALLQEPAADATRLKPPLFLLNTAFLI
jgi:hypothetical protein